MKILIVYASYSGSTLMASQTVMETLTKPGHNVVLKTAVEVKPEELTASDLIVLGSPSWDYDGKEGQPHEDFLKFIESMKSVNLENKPFAVFGLGDSSYMNFCGAVNVLEEFVKNVKGKLVVASLKIDGYFLDQQKSTQSLTDWAEKLVKTETV